VKDFVGWQVLVLDEADRILDMGFAGTLNAILAQLSKERQTMLFSATQTRSVQDLARLSMSDPEFLAVHAESAAATPARLQQTAMIVPLDEKLDMLWSFIKTHLHNKTLVFLSSCKQVSCLFFLLLSVQGPHTA
jgi:ATP-dependent RNA helicase DDX10/DBP4